MGLDVGMENPSFRPSVHILVAAGIGRRGAEDAVAVIGHGEEEIGRADASRPAEGVEVEVVEVRGGALYEVGLAPDGAVGTLPNDVLEVRTGIGTTVDEAVGEVIIVERVGYKSGELVFSPTRDDAVGEVDTIHRPEVGFVGVADV